MTDSWNIATRHREAIEQIQNMRGWIVGSYSQVEFLMADAIVRSQTIKEYGHLSKAPTFNVTKRVRRFRELINTPGPMSVHAEALGAVVDAWESTEETRHFLVHGFAIFRWTQAGDMMMTFRRYMPELDEADPFREMHFRPETMQRLRDRITEDTSAAVEAFAQMHRTMGWVGPADMPMRGVRD